MASCMDLQKPTIYTQETQNNDVYFTKIKS